MKIASLQNAEKTVVEGIEYAAGADGLFDVPEEVGKAMLGFKSLWALPWVKDAAEHAAKAAADLDPHKLAEKVDYALAHVAVLAEKADAAGAVVAALADRVAELEKKLTSARTAKPAAKPAAKS